MEPLNLTLDQRKQYEELDHTKNDCMPNALFVNLLKEKQAQFGDVQGMCAAAAQHIRAHSKIYNYLYTCEEKLRQIAPSEVPRMGFLPIIPVVLGAWTFYQPNEF